MELFQLRYFLAVASHGNFTRAAQELGLSQPALSRAIARLEEELGQPVLERKPRSIALTDAGTLLRTRAQQIFAIIENTKAEITDDGEIGVLRIAAIPTIAPYLLPNLLRAFSKLFPKASIQIIEDVTQATLKRCDQGEVDLAIVALPVSTKYLQVEELFEEELLLVLPAGHALAHKSRVSIEDLKSHPFVLLDEAHCLSDHIFSYCRQQAVQPVAMERTSQLATVQELVALNHGVSMIPAMARRVDADKRRFYRSMTGIKPMRKIAMIWNPYRFQSQLLENFKALLRKQAKI